MDLDRIEFCEESPDFPHFGGNTGLPALNWVRSKVSKPLGGATDKCSSCCIFTHFKDMMVIESALESLRAKIFKKGG